MEGVCSQRVRNLNTPANNPKQLSVLYYNARSLFPKMDNLHALVSLHKPDAIAIVETWLSPEIGDSEVAIPNYQLIRRDRDRHGGGIIVYVADRYSVKLLNKGSLDFEFMSISVHCQNYKACLCVLYRPPSSPFSYFDSVYSALESIDYAYFSNFIFVGDFNIDFYNPSHPLYSNLSTFLSTFALSQVVPHATHTSLRGKSTLIDLALVPSSTEVVSCAVVPPIANSDHNGVQLVLRQQTPGKQCTTNKRRIWRYARADWTHANNLLQAECWDDLLHLDANEAWTQWESRFMAIMEQCIPHSQATKQQNLPWVTKQVLAAMRKRNQLFRKAQRHGDSTTRGKYTSARNKALKLLKQAKRMYFAGLKPNSKQFWKTVKLQSKSSSTIPTLKHGTVEAGSDIGKASMLNQFFSECFNQSLPPLTAEDIENFQTCPDACPEEFLCTEEEVLNLLTTLDTSKASGPDKISGRMLKSTASSIAPTVTKLFNQSIRNSVFPQLWKTAAVVPIPKSPSGKDSPRHYRPISLLSVLSKLMERHVYHLIADHCLDHELLSADQWGFRPGRSTVSALVCAVDDWLSELEGNGSVCCAFFDLQKAFDSVPHRALLDKLSSLGFDNFLLKWLCDYLTGRTQQVVVNGSTSSSLPVTSGVPQGSVL